jgi:hypothetical protein
LRSEVEGLRGTLKESTGGGLDGQRNAYLLAPPVLIRCLW